MPQLNPTPWFTILIFTWLIFLTIMTPKIIAHTFPNMPTTQTTSKHKAKSWVWPWH